MKMFTTIGYLILGSLALLPLRANQGDLPTKEIRLNLVSLAQDDGSNVSVTENQFRSYIDALNEYNNHASNKGFLFYGIEFVVQSFQIHNSSALYNSATAGPVNNTIRSLYSKPRELTIWTNNKWYNAQGLTSALPVWSSAHPSLRFSPH